MIALLRTLSWPELRHHPLRHASALIAIALGVALGFAVQRINASALSEFSAAVRSINGQPDLELRGQREGFDETVYARVAAHPAVAQASPVIEIDTYAVRADGQRVALRVLGLDAFAVAPLAPALVPRPGAAAPPLAVIDPQAVFLNPAARRQFGEPAVLRVQRGASTFALDVRGSVAAEGPPLAVIDIAGTQQHFGWLGRLSRIDVRLAPGADRDAILRDLALPAGVRAASPDEAALRVSNLSRAYRVNLTVLSLVALFTGAFLVFSVLALSVAQRQPQLALLGVLGLSARERLTLVLAESALLGLVGSALGIALGSALAALALRQLSGDLGGGYFPGVRPALQFSSSAAVLYAGAGVLAALAAAWLPARAAQRLTPAQALKGLGSAPSAASQWLGPTLLAAGALLAFLPPVFGLPLAAYGAVACLLLGGIACVPLVVQGVLRLLPAPRSALAMLAVERARDQRHTASVAVAGVVASLSLAVALTVMVASFRDSMTQWLVTLLPADLYARTAVSTATADSAFLPAELVAGVAALPGVARVEAQRVVQLQIDATRPNVVLIARPLADPARRLPLVGELVDAPAGALAAYVSEAMVSLYQTTPGSRFLLPLPDGRRVEVFVRGAWRDYARQHGAVVLALDDFQRLTGDRRVNDLALWLRDGADPADVQQAIRGLAADPRLIEFATPGEIRAMSLRIFDRSFAVTYWLQAVAIAIGLFGIAASFSAQVLARRKEFGLLAHLGLTRREVLAVVASEGAVWTTAGGVLGLLLGLAVSSVLVHVVNPQSFHWTMDLFVPWARLGALLAAVLCAGTATAWLAARKAARRELALAVKEDW
jgi:putative ABC transport system permease protein